MVTFLVNVPVTHWQHSEKVNKYFCSTSPYHRLSSYTQMSSVAEPSIGSLTGSLEAEGQLEGREKKEG